ncbi:hypothetical protein [Stutzerimonas nitrititolerans]|uniref:hypothetical protein n=1 Tax=Stutzerimonas nitrititolerans TaxID=2482751 RepID=UPI0028A0FD37|nr:hypothetical protein [Stutzerimonas nitrititolerans]
MVTHYSTSLEIVACGRTGSSLNGTSDATQVSCKLCLRTLEKKTDEPVRKTPSLAELRAAAKAAKTAVAVTPETAKPAPTLTAGAEWQRRLEQLPGRNRLPRGVARQSFV